MTNLLEETVESITDSGHTVGDVVFVGSSDGKFGISWIEFEKLASSVNYDSGFGSSEVATDLIVLFSDGLKMWRGEYDGSEWWEYDAPTGATYDLGSAKDITRLAGGYWVSLTELHDPETPSMYLDRNS